LPNNANWKPLFSAAYFGRAAVIETLIYFGVNVNSVDAQRTALSIAVEDRHEEATRALLTLNATIDPTLIESTTRHPELHRLLCQFHEMPVLVVFVFVFRRREKPFYHPADSRTRTNSRGSVAANSTSRGFKYDGSLESFCGLLSTLTVLPNSIRNEFIRTFSTSASAWHRSNCLRTCFFGSSIGCRSTISRHIARRFD
jgi:hypothetical protein